jgi:hypothetical protein
LLSFGDNLREIQTGSYGKRVDEIAQKKFLFKTEEGLDFGTLNTLDDKVSKENDTFEDYI